MWGCGVVGIVVCGGVGIVAGVGFVYGVYVDAGVWCWCWCWWWSRVLLLQVGIGGGGGVAVLYCWCYCCWWYVDGAVCVVDICGDIGVYEYDGGVVVVCDVVSVSVVGVGYCW